MAITGYVGSGWREPLGRTGRTRLYKPLRATAARGAAGALGNVTLDTILNRYYSQMSTPAQQSGLAQRQVNDQIKMALAGIRASTAAEQAAYTKQQERATGFALAQQSLEGQYGAQALADYRQAGQDIQGLGTGLTGAVGAAQQEQANKAAADISALTGGRNTATGLDIPGMQNVAQYTGVTLPSSDLYTQAASAAASARYNTLANADKIHQIATEYAQKWQDAQHQLSLSRQELEAKRPGLYNDAVAALHDKARQDMATLVTALTLKNTVAATGSEITSRGVQDAINKALAPYKIAGAKASATGTTARATQTTAKTTGLLPGGALAPGYYWSSSDPKIRVPQPYDPKKFQLDPNDSTHSKLIPLPGTVSAGTKTVGSTGLTQSQLNSIIASRSGTLAKLVKGPPYAIVHQPDPFGLGAKVVTYTPALTLAQARQRALGRFPTALRKNPQVIAAVNDALSSVGYKA